MKKQYFLLTLAWLLFAVSGCKDDYRSVVLFEGAEPVYQVGTCDNLVSSLAFFLSETEGETVLGIDGGDGAYTLTNEHESVASVTFAGDSNGSAGDGRFRVRCAIAHYGERASGI